MESVVDFYSTLGLSEGADAGELKAAFRTLAKRYHPDSSRDPATVSRFRRVVKAYKVLTAAASNGKAEAHARGDEDKRAADLFALGTVSATSADPRARAEAIRRLSASGRRSAYVFLRRALYDDDEGVLAAAVRAVAALRVGQAGGELAALYVRASARVRAAIVRAAARGAPASFRPALEYAVADAITEARLRAEAGALLESMRAPR